MSSSARVAPSDDHDEPSYLDRLLDDENHSQSHKNITSHKHNQEPEPITTDADSDGTTSSGSGGGGDRDFAKSDDDAASAPGDESGSGLCAKVKYCGLYLYRYKYFGAHAVREMKKRKFNYCIAVTSCFLTVFVAAVCYTMMAKAPVVFLQQGESEHGQIDLLLSTPDSDDFAFLNFSASLRNAANVGGDEFSYQSPRNHMAAFIYNKACTAHIDAALGPTVATTSVSWRYNESDVTPALPVGRSPGIECVSGVECLSDVCAETESPTKEASLRLINSPREKHMALGRHWKHDDIPRGQVIITTQVANIRDLAAGDTVWIRITLSNNNPLLEYRSLLGLRNLGQLSSNLNETDELLATMRAFGTAVIPFTIWKVLDDVKGKFATSDDRIAIAERDEFWPYVLEHLNPRIPSHALAATLATNFDDFANDIAVNMPPERTEAYISTNYDVIQQRLISFGSRALYFIGFPDVDSEMGVLDSLSTLRFFTLFLGLILSVILTILFILSTMLIYSLLMISIQTRTFELGVHRMVGMNRFGIVEMLTVQSLSYSVPAWIVGLAVAQWVVHATLTVLEDAVEVPVSKELTPTSIIVATFLGLAIPILASLLPIRNALNQNLQDSLDTTHSKTMAVKVTIERSEDQAISAPAIVLGVGSFVFGFSIYYLLPLALLSFNLTLLFNIFFSLLLGTLFGLVLLSLNIEHLVEQAVTAIFLWWEKRAVRTLVLKNLIAHRIRNRKTAMMYALSIGFIIFITVSFALELKTAEARTLKANGSKLRVEFEDNVALDVVADYEAILRGHPAFKRHAWYSARLGEHDENEGIYITTKGRIMELEAILGGISPGFYDTTLNEYLIRRRHDTSTGTSISEQLYTIRGSQTLVSASALLKSHDFNNIDDEFLLAAALEPDSSVPDIDTKTVNLRLLRGTAFLDSSPAAWAMQRLPTEQAQDALVSLPSYVRMSNGAVQSVGDIRYKALIIEPNSAASDEELDDLVKELSALSDQQSDAEVWDFRDFKDSLDRSNAVMSLIFGVATYIAMGLCLFSLMASMYTNIFEQSKEIAILRALGLYRMQIVRIYVYEAFVLVFSASFLGIMIGSIMAWTMMAQRVLFTQLPVSVEFPYVFMLLVVVGSIVCAFLSSFAPARRLVQKTIAQVMRTVV